MKNYAFDDVYLTVLGEVHGADTVPGVENAYAEGSECDRLYSEMLDAYERICQRLDIQGEDADVEIIIGNLLSIQSILCEKMFYYGKTHR